MINLKRIDFYGQLILIITFALLSVLLSFDYAFIGYFIVGGWQIISALIHFFAKNNLLRNSLRKLPVLVRRVGLGLDLELSLSTWKSSQLSMKVQRVREVGRRFTLFVAGVVGVVRDLISL